MLKKLSSLLILLVVLYALPLGFSLEMILNFKVLTLIAITIVLWLTQPAIDSTAKREAADQRTVQLILLLSIPAVIIPLLFWSSTLPTVHRNALDVVHLSGLVLMIGGLGLRIYAIRVLDRYFTAQVVIQEDHKLITHGPYKVLRHPSYTGAYLCYLGSALWLGVWPGVLAAALLMGYAYYKRVTVEEQALQERFGNAYDAYRGNTWRMIPYAW